MKAFLAAGAALVLALPAAQAGPVTYAATLSGTAEFPANASPATGAATVIFDDVLHTLNVQVTFSGLLGTTTASHIHCCTSAPSTGNAGVATQTPSFVGFPLGVTSGSYSNVFDLTLPSSWNPAFVTAHGGLAGAEAAFASALAADETYFNIHTSAFGGGEIRGFLQPVPEPSTYALLALGLTAVGATARRRA